MPDRTIRSGVFVFAFAFAFVFAFAFAFVSSFGNTPYRSGSKKPAPISMIHNTNKSQHSALMRKAPSGRELSAKLTEGECVTMKIIKTSKSRMLLPHAPRATFLMEEGFFATPIITKIGRENNFSAEIFVPPVSPLKCRESRWLVIYCGL